MFRFLVIQLAEASYELYRSNYNGDIYCERWLIIHLFFLITANWLSGGSPANVSFRNRPGNETHSSKLIKTCWDFQTSHLCRYLDIYNRELASLQFYSTRYLFSQYEYKTQNAKKKKVTIEISVDGVRICLKKRKRKMRVVSFRRCWNVFKKTWNKRFFIVFLFRENHKIGPET